MKIPYGQCNFGDIRREGLFYVDKTPFLPVLESAELGHSHLVFLRPRRFGKSTFVSMLAHYYDVLHREHFDELFGGLWIHEHPTPERGRYLVLLMDFSGVATGGDQRALEQSFLNTVKQHVFDFVFLYRDVAPELAWLTERIDGYESAEALLGGVLSAVRRTGLQLHVLIDEYDHFANRLLSDGAGDLYEQSIVKRTGFVRTFYAKLKMGTLTGLVRRMFITGVTPLMLDDLSSGFNVARNVSTSDRFHALAGFTRADVERAVDEFLAGDVGKAALPVLGDRGETLAMLTAHYNGYRFSPEVTERVFNSDMVLYFLSEVADRGALPEDMLDPNVRTDYSHLQRIGAAGGTQAGERRELLSTILSEGRIRTELIRRFGVKSLGSRASFLSLLYYLGMLTLAPGPRYVEGYEMEIPNRVIRELQWEHLALMLDEQTQIAVDIDDVRRALGAMAVNGDIAPFLDLFHARVIRALGVKDMRGLSEKTIKLLLMTYASLGHIFYPLSEKEFAQGYCDLFLGVSPGIANARYSWLLELKYLPTAAKPAQIESAFAAAAEQVGRYLSDAALLPLLRGSRDLRSGMLVFVGARRVLFRPWPAEGSPALEQPAPRPGRRAVAPQKKPRRPAAPPGPPANPPRRPSRKKA